MQNVRVVNSRKPLGAGVDLPKLVERSLYIDELMATPRAGRAVGTTEARRCLSAWCKAATNGDWRLFARRLKRDGLTFRSAMLALEQNVESGHPLPAWSADVEWIVEALFSRGDATFGSPANPQLPFQNLFTTLVLAAELRRNENCSVEVLSRVDAAVLESMRRDLLITISTLFAPILFSNFQVYRQQHAFGGCLERDDAVYSAFTRDPPALFEKLFFAKPVLLRLLTAEVSQWICVSSEFLNRLNADLGHVRKWLLGASSATPVAEITNNISDRHNFGRSVCIVRFEDGTKVVYKPRCVLVDKAWHDLVCWLNANAPPCLLKAPKVVVRDGYGWCEFMEMSEPLAAEGASRFFERAGALIALLYLFGAGDMHQENLIATGEFPVPIDLEGLLQPVLAVDITHPAAVAVLEADLLLRRSILGIGLLPSFVQLPDTRFVKQGGLVYVASEDTEQIAWLDVNKDRMRFDRQRTAGEESRNLPSSHRTSATWSQFQVELVRGCEAYFAYLLAQKDNLLADEGPLEAFRTVTVRYIHRPTRFYGFLLSRARHTSLMGDGRLWSSQLDFVSRFADLRRATEPSWGLVRYEREAMANLNVPYFTLQADQTQVRVGGKAIPADLNLVPGFLEVADRIRGLDEAAIQKQLLLLRLNTAAEVEYRGEKAAPSPGSTVAVGVNQRRAVVLECCTDIFSTVLKQALKKGSGAAWVGLDPLVEGGVGLNVLGSHLYGGATGIAIFLAAYARTVGSNEARALSLAALAWTRHTLKGSQRHHFSRVIGIGGANGLGSIIYGFAVVSEMLDDDSLRKDALDAAALLSDELIEADRGFDVISGAAGCVLALLGLHRRQPHSALLVTASKCARQLIDKKLFPSGDALQIGTGDSLLLTGFSHGAAGYGYALSALSTATGNAEFEAAAQSCIRYERSLFSPVARNWPDLRVSPGAAGPKWICQWCHGATGIGLARLGALRFGRPQKTLISSDLDAALAAVLNSDPCTLDTLCCGNAGNIEFLNDAAVYLSRDDLREAAWARVLTVLSRARVKGTFAWDAGPDYANLGLFRGMSGLGYMLLRHAAPATLPNVLLWE